MPQWYHKRQAIFPHFQFHPLFILFEKNVGRKKKYTVNCKKSIARNSKNKGNNPSCLNTKSPAATCIQVTQLKSVKHATLCTRPGFSAYAAVFSLRQMKRLQCHQQTADWSLLSGCPSISLKDGRQVHKAQSMFCSSALYAVKHWHTIGPKDQHLQKSSGASKKTCYKPNSSIPPS